MKALLALLLFATPAAASELSLGDSIALGTGRALNVETIAKVGASSCWILSHTPRQYYDQVVISAGVNDPPGSCVSMIRAALNAGQVIWIRPINAAGPTVDRIAAEHGDTVIRYRVGKDHLHPASYAEVSETVRRAWSH